MNKDTLITIGLISMVVIVFSVIAYAIYYTESYFNASFDKTYIVIEDEIIDTSTVLDDDGSLDYIVVTFSNGESYDIKPSKEVDLTVSSRLILELYHYNNEGFYDTDVWHIKSIIRVPDLGDEQ